MTIRFLVLIILFNGLANGGDIHKTGNREVFTRSPAIEDVYKVFDSLLVMSDKLYQARKIEKLTDDGPIFSRKTWPAGTWGRGYYTKDIEYYPKEYFSEKYTGWINNERSCNPLIREIGRRIIGYIHEYRNGAHTDLRQINEALQYLIDVQLPNGGYVWWFKRKGKYNIEGVPDTTGNLYTTSIALRALCEGYELINSSLVNDTTKNTALIAKITNSADFITKYPNIEVNYPNAKLLAVWSLAGAYKITGNHKYHDTSVNLVFGPDLEQRADGSWVTPDIREVYHDANIFYHGMNLRGLAELYSILRNNDQRKQLRGMIIRTINHVIDYNGGNKTRLNTAWDGAFESDHTSIKDKSAERGMILLGGLILTRKYVDFESEDKVRIDRLINYTINGMVYIGNKSVYYRYADADIAIHNLGMYLGSLGYVSR